MTTTEPLESKKDPISPAERRRMKAGQGWADYLGLEYLVNAKHIRQDEHGMWRQDSYEHGATGDGANLFILVEDDEGTHAVKVGAGEFSPRTFLEDDDYYGMEPRSYATRLKELTAITPIYVLEQDDGYFKLSPAYNSQEFRQFSEDPASYLAEHARMVASDGRVDFNNRYHQDREGSPIPLYATDYNGSMVDLQGIMESVPIENLETALRQAMHKSMAATAISSAAR